MSTGTLGKLSKMLDKLAFRRLVDGMDRFVKGSRRAMSHQSHGYYRTSVGLADRCRGLRDWRIRVVVSPPRGKRRFVEIGNCDFGYGTFFWQPYVNWDGGENGGIECGL